MTHSILIKGIISALLGILMLSGCTNHETEKPLDLPADLFREGEILYFEKVQASPAKLCCRPIKKAPILTPVFSNSLMENGMWFMPCPMSPTTKVTWTG